MFQFTTTRNYYEKQTRKEDNEDTPQQALELLDFQIIFRGGAEMRELRKH